MAEFKVQLSYNLKRMDQKKEQIINTRAYTIPQVLMQVFADLQKEYGKAMYEITDWTICIHRMNDDRPRYPNDTYGTH
jgi:hypothetical protein